MFEELMEGLGGLGGWAVALGVVVAAPVVLRVARPVAKSALKGYFALADSVKTATERTREELRDVVEEAKAERQPRTEVLTPANGA